MFSSQQTFTINGDNNEDEAHCPHFGQPFVTGEMIDEKTGKVLTSFTGGRIVFKE